MKPEALLSFEAVSKVFGKTNILNRFSWKIMEKESWVLVGSSGSGKSVAMKVALGLLEPDEGYVVWDSKKKANVGVVFQSSALFDSLTVWENIGFQSWVTGKKNRAEIKNQACEALLRVGLPTSCLPLYPHELSGGMKRRVALARATFQKPDMVFYDEPTAGLDPMAARYIGALIQGYHQENPVTSVTISHDLANLSKFGSYVAFLHQGQLVWRGPVENFFKEPHPAIHAFLGRS